MATIYHIGISGGKDSTALLLWAVHESGLPLEFLCASFCDTGNEHELTYAHVRMLSEQVMPVVWLKPERDFYELARHKKRFPSTKARFCTQELKLKPTQKHIESLRASGVEVVALSGVRADESAERSKLTEWGDPTESYYFVREWRPLLRWRIEDVWLIHKRYNIKPNPLYAMGAQRVGCLPCIMSRKAEIKMMARNFPERVDVIRQAERDVKNDAGLTKSFYPPNKIPKEFCSREVETKDGRMVRVPTIDEYGYDENPLVWLAEQRTKHEESDDFESMAVIAVEVVDAEITKRLNPELDTIAGKVVDD